MSKRVREAPGKASNKGVKRERLDVSSTELMRNEESGPGVSGRHSSHGSCRVRLRGLEASCRLFSYGARTTMAAPHNNWGVWSRQWQ